METTKYEAKTTTTVSEGPGIGIDRSYPLSIQGILTAITVLAAFCMGVSCAVPTLYWNWTSAAGFSGFVAWEILIAFIVMYVFYLVRLLPRLPGPIGLAMLIYLLVNLVFLVVSIILCATNIGFYGGPAASAMVFAVLTIGCHFAIGFFLFQKWRASGHEFHKGECGRTFTSSTATTTATAAAPSGEPDRY